MADAVARTCTVEGCGRAHLAKGLCRKHYYRKVRHGTVEMPDGGWPVEGQCSVGGCRRPEGEQGLCERHLLRRQLLRPDRLETAVAGERA